MVPTPAPTPEPSLKEPPSPVSTPDLSEHLSMALSPKKNHQESASPGLTGIFMNILNHSPYTWCQQTQQIFVKVLAQLFTHISQLYNYSAFVSGPDRIPVGTPTTTPIPSPTRVATPSPPPANQSPVSATLQHHPWGGRELPLEEEEEPHGERQDQQPESVYV